MTARAQRVGAAALACLLIVGCTTPTPVHSPVPASSAPPSNADPASPTPSVVPSETAPVGEMPPAPGSSLSVGPVDYEGSTVVRAAFSRADLGEGRSVVLQRRINATWQEVASQRMSQSGRVEFLVLGRGDTYRAVAVDAGKELKAVATVPARAADQWQTQLSSGFEGSELPKPWGYRLTDVYDAGGRWCAAPRKANVALSKGALSLTMSRASAGTAARVSTSAKRKQAQAGQKQVGCPEGVYDNAMISTEGRFSLTSGIVAARVKFPKQPGAHASVWLQSAAAQEIDMIETFGYGRGITNVIHVNGRKMPSDSKQAYVIPKVVAEPAWWDAWHTVSVEWHRDAIQFRLDGKVTRTLDVRTARANYFLVVSLLSSDWETYRVTRPDARPGSGVEVATVPKPKLPFSMSVDWVRAWRSK
jgi:hypothetical protein